MELNYIKLIESVQLFILLMKVKKYNGTFITNARAHVCLYPHDYSTCKMAISISKTILPAFHFTLDTDPFHQNYEN